MNRLDSPDFSRAQDLFPPHLDRIVGLSDTNQLVTLEHCAASSASTFIPSAIVSKTAYRPHSVLIGAGFAESEAVRLEALELRFTDMDPWATTSGFEVRVANDRERLDIAYHLPDDFTARVTEETTIRVKFAWRMNTIDGYRPTEVRLRQEVRFRVDHAGGLSLDEVRNVVYQLRNFLGLAIGRTVQPESVIGTLHVTPVEIREGPTVLDTTAPEASLGIEATPELHEVEILWRLADYAEPHERRLLAVEMVFTLGSIAPRFEDILRRWFAKQETLRPVFDLYFAAIYNRHAYLDQKFLTLVQGLETYHRRTTDETKLPPEEHVQITAQIMAAMPDLPAWIVERVRFGNELTLHERLVRILALCPQVTSELIGDCDAFVRHIKQARNYLTHYDPSLERRAPRGLSLYPLTLQLRALLEMCLLKELGFEREAITEMLRRVRRFEEVHVAAER